MKTLSVEQLQTLLQQAAVTVIDVREDEELAIAALPGALHIPLQTLPARIGELDRTAPLAMLCHHGMRSEMAGRWLEAQGFSDVSNVAGGIDAWSLRVDPTVPQY